MNRSAQSFHRSF